MSVLTFHTTPSRWMGHGELTAQPYKRVVGVETAAGLIACRFAIPDKLTPVTFDVPEEMAIDVADFFDEHIADVDPEQNTAGYPGHFRYNCHVFALALKGIKGTSIKEMDVRIKEFETTTRPFTGTLEAGVHGLVHNPEIDDLSHSFIGLGSDSPLTLQVMSTNSNMALLPYRQLVPEYSRYQGGQYVLAA